MSTELLSLAIAAAMPLVAFALYAAFRALGERRTRRSRRPFRPRPSRPARPTIAAVSRPPVVTKAADVARPPDPGPLGGSVQARVESTPREAARRVLERLTGSHPNDTGLRREHGSIPPTAPTGDLVAPAIIKPHHAGLTRPEPSPALPRAGATMRAAGSAPDRRARLRAPTLLSGTLGPIRKMLGRGHDQRSSVPPSWPAPERLEELFLPQVSTIDGSGPCPFCEDSRERGAWFCRRCRRPVDHRATAAASAVSLGTGPLGGPATSPLATPHRGGVPARPDPARLIARLPVVRPTQLGLENGRASGSYLTRESPGPPARPVRPQAPSRQSVSSSTSQVRGPTIVSPPAIVAPATRPAPNGGQSAAALCGLGPGHAADRGRAEPAKTTREVEPRQREEARVDLNLASAAELSGLSGVGRVTAKRIVAAREEEAFASVDALLERRVIGRSVLDRLRDQVRV